MALAWKAGWVQALRGSNPLSSATLDSVRVTVRVLRRPTPAVLAHLVDGATGGPAQLALGLCGVGVRLGDVPGTPGGDLVGQVLAASPGEGVDHLLDRRRPAGAEVPGRHGFVCGSELLEGGDVAGGEVLDVEV